MQRFVKRAGMAEATKEQIASVQEATGLSAPVAALLCARGIGEPVAAKRFLHPGPEQFFDPLLLPDMAAATERIKTAIRQKERITIFCDYDADGTTGGCALYLYLQSAGANVYIQTPNRHREGYGLSTASVEDIAAQGSTLIITVDCGITNIEETALAKSLGIDVVITDHHVCGEALPGTPYIVSAKRRGSLYPDDNLAGCGVAFKLIHALSSLSEAMRYIDLIAIGTITDIVPLLGENRVIAHMGLERLRKNPSAGIAALAQAAGTNLSAITSFGISFGLGPRINAAGRMDTAHLAIDILKQTKQSAALAENAKKLCMLNDRRRQEVDDIVADAQTMIDSGGYHSDPAILLASPGWNAGVIGIAAAKIAERYARPCVLFGGEESLIGSARSIEGVNIFMALAAFADRYQKFGGHAQAAGLTIEPHILDALREDVCGYLAAHYDESAFVHRRCYDMELSVRDITKALVEDIERLEPFGQSNEKPAIALTDAAFKSPRFVGKEKKPHLKLLLAQADALCEAVAFYYKDAHALVPQRADVICEAGLDSFSGKPQLVVHDVSLKYSEKLIESFTEAYAPCLMDSFFAEVAQIKQGLPDALTEAQFSQQLEAELKKSRFGLCIVAATPPALRYLIRLPGVSDALNGGRLVLWDEKAYTPDNCIACGQAPGHTRLLRAGVPQQDQPALWNDTLKSAYRSEAQRYFATREELLALHRKLPALIAHRPRTAAELIQKLGTDAAKAAFALRVFFELELLEVDKSDRILALKSSQPKKDLRDSACFMGFEDLING